jgi:hypothetical protein
MYDQYVRDGRMVAGTVRNPAKCFLQPLPIGTSTRHPVPKTCPARIQDSLGLRPASLAGSVFDPSLASLA